MICSSLQTYIFFFDFAASPRKYRKLKPVALRNEPKNHLFFPDPEHKQLRKAHHCCLHNFRVIVRREHSYNRGLYILYAYYHEEHLIIEYALFTEHQSVYYSDLTHINKHTAVYIYEATHIKQHELLEALQPTYVN
mgnify:CR=1 FL=1